MSSVVGSQYGATTVAVESLIAQLDSKGKLTTPRQENQKNFTRKRDFKHKQTPFVYVYELQIYRLIPKNICSNT
jgi:hypothetical protein